MVIQENSEEEEQKLSYDYFNQEFEPGDLDEHYSADRSEQVA